MKDIFPKFALKQLSTYIAIVVVFIHNNVLDKDLQCSCDKKDHICGVYMALPFFILFVLQLWRDKKFQIAWKYTYACTCNCNCIAGYDNYTKRLCRVFCILVHHIMKAVFIGLLWAVSVLIDGDWYVCCWTDQSDKELACKAKTNSSQLTAEERKTITKLKNLSWIIGISILFCALFLSGLISTCERMKCCVDSACCNRKNLYYKVILEEEKDVLREILTKTAKEKLTEEVENKIRNEEWEDCFDVAKDLIKAEGNQDIDQKRMETARALVGAVHGALGGALVGALGGAGVGAAFGAAPRIAVTAAAGATIGATIGPIVGAIVGAMFGAVIGYRARPQEKNQKRKKMPVIRHQDDSSCEETDVAAIVACGAIAGAISGAGAGTGVGAIVGPIVGLVYGKAVGAAVGAAVGSAVGAAVGGVIGLVCGAIIAARAPPQTQEGTELREMEDP